MTAPQPITDKELRQKKPAPGKLSQRAAALAPKAKKPSTAVAVHKPSLPAAPKTFLQVCYDAARDKSVDVAKMREIMALAQEQEARAILNPAIIAVQAERPVVVANSLNSHTKSKWARLEQVSKVLDPIMKRHNLSISWGMSDSPIEGHYRVIGDLLHTSGAQRRYFLDAPSDALGPKGMGNKSAVQGIGSTISYLRRYLKLMIFDVTVVGEDNDASRTIDEAIGEVDLNDLNAKMTAAQVNTEAFCNYFGIDAVPDLPKKRLAEALTMVARKAAS